MAARTARGMRDFLPEAVSARRRAMETLRGVFERYGFEPIETPAVESLETLLGKYGDEGDSLIFRILKRGEGGQRGEADLGLRYDLTVPLARVVAQHRAELPMPLRRYQMQPVWRADRPAKGRFREFLQCDVDVVGSASSLADAEVLALTSDGLAALGLGDEVAIQLNHRAVLHAVVELSGIAADLATTVLVVLDKLDKVGPEAVKAEWADRGVPDSVVEGHLAGLVALSGSNEDVLAGLAERLGGHEGGRRAVVELRELVAVAEELGVPPGRVRVTPSLARGLSYYTGPIFEAVVEGAGGGSITGGGRYDGLVKRLGGPDLPAVGTSFGLERILALLEARGGSARASAADLYVALPWAETLSTTLRVARSLRSEGVRTLVASTVGGKLLKHFQEAERRSIRWVAFVGADEAARGRVVLRDVLGRAQTTLELGELPGRILGARP